MSRKSAEKKQLILNYITEMLKENGYPPSVREIGAAVGLSSTSSVHAYLNELQAEGLIEKTDTKTRALRVLHPASPSLPDSEEVVQVPVVGDVAAGALTLAVESVERSFPVPLSLAGNSETFMLRIKGESMIEAGIFDGDLVLVKKQPTAQNGDIVIALVEDEATCKRFYKENGHFRLQPENAQMAPIIVREVSILGKVVSLFREDVR